MSSIRSPEEGSRPPAKIPGDVVCFSGWHVVWLSSWQRRNVVCFRGWQIHFESSFFTLACGITWGCRICDRHTADFNDISPQPRCG